LLARLGLVALCTVALIGCVPGMYGSTRPLVKIGLAAPFEGLGRPLGYEALQGVKVALAERNAAGGVGGYMVELVALNDLNEPAEAYAQAAEFAADPAILGVVTGWNNAVAPAVLPAYRLAGLAVVVPWSVAAELADPEGGIMLLAADTGRIAQAVAHQLSASTADETVAVAGEAAAIQPYLERFERAGRGVPLPIGSGGAAIDEWVRRLLLARTVPPEVLLLITDGARAGDIVLAARATSWPGPIVVGPDAASPQLATVAGAAADGVLVISPAPAAADLAPGREGGGAEVAELGPRAVMAYDATQVLLGAIELAVQANGTPTRAGVVRALPAVRVRGLTGDITFDDKGRRVNAGVWRYRTENGHYPGRLME
jgi:branched-chain amino acid transport system substrate-binding protein